MKVQKVGGESDKLLAFMVVTGNPGRFYAPTHLESQQPCKYMCSWGGGYRKPEAYFQDTFFCSLLCILCCVYVSDAEEFLATAPELVAPIILRVRCVNSVAVRDKPYSQWRLATKVLKSNMNGRQGIGSAKSNKYWMHLCFYSSFEVTGTLFHFYFYLAYLYEIK